MCLQQIRYVLREADKEEGMMNNYKHMMIMLKALYMSSYGSAANMYQATSDVYHRGFMDALDICIDQLTRAIKACDKDGEKNE